ncbi:hypothetical protein WJT74_03230 [Sphingomicrobium sp. XHP0239]|uniref:hypothetical protein n=1 Tax=Sphingomicrobium maritimum TaxID=3133972 RepID=UPI0031CC60C2
MTILTVLFATTLASSASVGQPQPIEDAAPDEEIVVEKEVPKPVCKSIRLTGTRFKQKICRTPRDWREEVTNMQEMREDLRRDGQEFTTFQDAETSGDLKTGIPNAPGI